MARLDPMFGVLIPLDAVDSLAVKGSGTFESDYTEAAPAPGVWTPNGEIPWSVTLSGDQNRDVRFYAVRGGYPDRDGAMVVARDESGTTYQGWSDPNCITRFTVPSDYTVDTFSRFAIATNSLTQEVVIVAHKVSASAVAYTWKYDSKTLTWTAGYVWASGPGLDAPIVMAEDPVKPGRILLWSGKGADAYSEDTLAFYSDDSGATWTRYSQGLFDNGQSAYMDRPAVGVHPSDDWLMFTAGSAANSTAQYSSSDHGVSWQLVVADIDAELFSTGASGLMSVARGPRGYVVAYLTDTDGFPAVKVLNSARGSFSDATEIILDFFGTNQKADDIVVATDADGSVYAWVFLNTTTGAAVTGSTAVYRSDDGGYTWTPYRRLLWGNSTVDSLNMESAAVAFANGQAHIVGICPGHLHMGLVTAGGWGNVSAGSSQPETINRQYQLGFTKGDITGDNAVCYIPLDSFASSGWTTVTVGVGAESAANGGYTLTGNALTDSYSAEYILETTAKDYVCGMARVKKIGGNTRATVNTSYIRQTLQDTATPTGVDLRIYLGSDGFEVRDGATTVLSSWAIDGSVLDRWIEFRWHLRHVGGSAFATVWRKLSDPGNTGDGWIQIANEVALTPSVAVTNTSVKIKAQYGGVVGIETVVVQTLASAVSSDWRYGLESVADLDLTPANGIRGITLSRPLPPRGYAYPIPIASYTAGDAGFFAGSGGPVYVDQYGTVFTGYQYPIASTDPRVSPSPSAEWRATGTGEVELVYDAGGTYWRGGALAIVAISATFATAELSLDDGAGGWTVAGTFDKTSSVTFARNGNDIRPSGATVVARYIPENSLVGGYFIFPTGGAPPDTARRIVRNSGGYFNASAGQPIRVTVEGTTGAEDTSGTGTLVSPSGVAIFYPASDAARRYLRIRIPAAQSVPADGGTDGATAAYSAGSLFAARVVGIGTEPEWTHTRTVALPAAVSRRRDGTPSMVRTGPARRSISYGFSPSAAVKMRTVGTGTIDFIAASGGVPIGADQDTWGALPAIIDGLDRGPVVIVPRLPATSRTLTDPTHFLYGLATSDSLSLTYGEGGTEGIDEIVAVGGLTVEELT